MITREGVAATLALIGAALCIEISDATLEVWHGLIDDENASFLTDEALKQAAVRVLRTWESTWMIPPGVILREASNVGVEIEVRKHVARLET